MKKVLGKGLSALIPDRYVQEAKTAGPAATEPRHFQEPQEREPQGLRMIPIVSIVPNVDQPRKEFVQEKIEELAASIKEKGILQPVIVRRMESGSYMLICGERRLRAAELCGLSEIPAIIKDVAPSEFLEWALIENIQRQDLNPMEEAQAYGRLAEEQMISQEEIAKRVGKNRSTITNMLRLLRLPEEVKSYLASGQLSNGHARAILGLLTPEHQRQLARRIVQDNLSVRQVEAIVSRSNAQKRKPRSARFLKPEIVDLENRLSQHFGSQVKIYPRKNQKEGRLEVWYFSLDELDRILEKTGLSKI